MINPVKLISLHTQHNYLILEIFTKMEQSFYFYIKMENLSTFILK